MASQTPDPLVVMAYNDHTYEAHILHELSGTASASYKNVRKAIERHFSVKLETLQFEARVRRSGERRSDDIIDGYLFTNKLEQRDVIEDLHTIAPRSQETQGAILLLFPFGDWKKESWTFGIKLVTVLEFKAFQWSHMSCVYKIVHGFLACCSRICTNRDAAKIYPTPSATRSTGEGKHMF